MSEFAGGDNSTSSRLRSTTTNRDSSSSKSKSGKSGSGSPSGLDKSSSPENSKNYGNKVKMGSRKGASSGSSVGGRFSLKKAIIIFVIFATSVYIGWSLLRDDPNLPKHSVGWWDENFHLPLGFQKMSYAVVIDAGSTGTRVTAFAFHQLLSDNNLKLKATLFEELKPGLSSFADKPADAALNLHSLIDKAKNFIPKTEWSSTPITLKATAGLRLLQKDKAEAILGVASDVIAKCGFFTTDHSVGIMDGVDEGIFSWFTVNFLLDRIGGPMSKTVAALDLGGGSTQITVASSHDTVSLYPKEDVLNVTIFHEAVPLYTHSYLGLGLQSVRKEVLSYGQDGNNKNLTSPCVNPKVSREWSHGGHTYTIHGTPNDKFQKVQYDGFVRKEPVADWDACYKIIVKVIEDKGVIKSRDLNRQITVFSYFTERAAEAGLVDPFDGGKLTLQNYFDAGKNACNTVNADLPLICLDLTFMGALLHNGYGLAKHTPILALKKVYGHEISWALGSAYHMIQNDA